MNIFTNLCSTYLNFYLTFNLPLNVLLYVWKIGNLACFMLAVFDRKKSSAGADAINKFTPSLGIPYLGV